MRPTNVDIYKPTNACLFFLIGKLLELKGLQKAGWWPISGKAFEVTYKCARIFS